VVVFSIIVRSVIFPLPFILLNSVRQIIVILLPANDYPRCWVRKCEDMS